jgi:3-mercaptopyruvate sulfurtransferase SseA
VALQLRKHGIRHVRPLLGGFHEWKKLGFPMADIPPPGEHYPEAGNQIAAEGSA